MSGANDGNAASKNMTLESKPTAKRRNYGIFRSNRTWDLQQEYLEWQREVEEKHKQKEKKKKLGEVKK